MNIRTIISTIVSALAFGNLIISEIDIGILDGHPTAQAVYKVLSFIFAGAAWLNSHYFNQDFTEEGCEGTGHTRYLKTVKKLGEYEMDPNEIIDEEGERWVG